MGIEHEDRNTRKKRFGIWSDEEKRYLLKVASDGAALAAVALNREQADVEEMARAMGIALAERPPVGERELCPYCCERYIKPGTRAGKSGMCIVCWERRKTEAVMERASFVESLRVYDAARKAVYRERRAHGRDKRGG